MYILDKSLRDWSSEKLISLYVFNFDFYIDYIYVLYFSDIIL